jgi:putative oxidoreductase
MTQSTTISLGRSGEPLALHAASLAGRLALGAIFVISGVTKLADPSGAIAYIASVGLPLPEAAYAVAVGLELGAGIALIIGIQTRLAALLLALFSVVAAFAFHNGISDQNQFNHFFKNIAITGGLLQVVAFGAGRFSLDARS